MKNIKIKLVRNNNYCESWYDLTYTDKNDKKIIIKDLPTKELMMILYKESRKKGKK